MKIQSPKMREVEALGCAHRCDIARSRRCQLRGIVRAAGRWVTVSAGVLVIHFAALKYIFLPS